MCFCQCRPERECRRGSSRAQHQPHARSPRNAGACALSGGAITRRHAALAPAMRVRKRSDATKEAHRCACCRGAAIAAGAAPAMSAAAGRPERGQIRLLVACARFCCSPPRKPRVCCIAFRFFLGCTIPSSECRQSSRSGVGFQGTIASVLQSGCDGLEVATP